MKTFKTHGVCAQEIQFNVEDDIIKKINFIGGCSGSSQGVARLVEGMSVDDAITKLEGIKCGFRATSCPDQLAKALKQAYRE